MPLRLESRSVGDVMVVECEGRLVAGDEAQALQRCFAEYQGNCHDIVLQLDRVKFVDSSGLGALVRLMHSARAKQGNVRLCSVPATLRRVLEITSLDKLFEIYDSVEEAVVASHSGSSDGQGGSSSSAD